MQIGEAVVAQKDVVFDVEALPPVRPPELLVDGLAERCGFFGPGTVLRSEAEVRAAVVAGAVAEQTAWLNAGVLREENDDAMFGRLVAYWLSINRNIRPDTLTAMQTTLAGRLNYRDRRARVRELLAGAPGTTTPANLAALVNTAVRQARGSHLDTLPWSAAWVSSVVRAAGITLGLEAFTNNMHHGRNNLLLPASAHSRYTLEADNRRRRGQRGTYHAFDPALRSPQLGDIIIQDRQARRSASCLTFARIRWLSRGWETHGDIVIKVGAGFVLTLGGNVNNSVRLRWFPLDVNGRLIVDPTRLYTQEDDQRILPPIPAAIEASSRVLDPHNTLRIFALLSPVIECSVIPGQLFGGGVLA